MRVLTSVAYVVRLSSSVLIRCIITNSRVCFALRIHDCRFVALRIDDSLDVTFAFVGRYGAALGDIAAMLATR